MKYLVLVVALLVAGGGYSSAIAMQLTPQLCRPLAEFAATVALIRDLGADQEKHLSAIRAANPNAEPGALALAERMVKAVYASRGSPNEVGQAVYRWCLAGGDGEPV